jgi:hypothetical protein
MPARSDLIGQTFAELTVMGRGWRRGRDRYWRVRCLCGRVETYPQRRLSQNRRDAVKVCAVCRARACAVCGAELPRASHLRRGRAAEDRTTEDEMAIHTLYTIHATDADHLAEVTAEMRVLGAPTVRVVDCGDHYMALEGTHRLHAAADLGLAPNLIVLAQDDLVAADSLDWDYRGLWVAASYTAGELAGEVFAPAQAQVLYLNNDGVVSRSR